MRWLLAAGRIGVESMHEDPIQITDIDFTAVGDEATAASAKSLELIAELHRRKAKFYAGGPAGPVADLLADDIVWHVVGESPLADVYRGWDAVLQGLSTAREMSRESLRVCPGEVVAAGGEVIVQLLDAAVLLDGEEVSWEAAGLYRVGAGRVWEAWLVPLELAWFDRIWTSLDR
jgi:ketosteroid isomerase-like protein